MALSSLFSLPFTVLNYVMRALLAPVMALRSLLGLTVPPNVYQGLSGESRRLSAVEFKSEYERLMQAAARAQGVGEQQLELIPFRPECYTSVLLSALNHPTASSPAMQNLSAPPAATAFEPSLVVVYLHSSLVPHSSTYLTKVFSHPSIRRILTSSPYNGHGWGGDVTTSPEAYSLFSSVFSPRSLPCVIVVTTVDLDGSSLISSEPPTLPPAFDASKKKRGLGACVGRFACTGTMATHEKLAEFLQATAGSARLSRKTVGEARGRMWQDRWLRSMQDEEFRRGAEEDRRREDGKREEIARIKAEETSRVSRLNAKKEEGRKKISEIKDRMRSRASLGGKPVKVRITCPSGRRVDRPFDEDSIVCDIRDFIDLLLHEVRKKARKNGAAMSGGDNDDDDVDEETDDAIKPFIAGSAGEQDVADGKIRKYALHTNYPKRTLDDNAKTFKEMGLVGQAVIMVVDLDS